MALPILVVFGVLLVAIVLFVTEWVRVDAVAMLVMLSLVLTGVLGFEHAVAGFSNEAVITVASILVLSGALARTGVANIIGDRVLGIAGTNRTALLVIMMLTVGLLSGFMNDIGVTALMLPVVVDLARRIGTAPSKLLIPLAYGSLLGGMTTMIGTAPNVLVSGALSDAGLERYKLFDFAPIGYAALAAGVLYMVTIGHRLLPDRQAETAEESVSPDRLGGQYDLEEVLFAATVPDDSWLVGHSLAESHMGSALGITVVSVRRKVRRRMAPPSDYRLEAGDRLLLSGNDELLRATHAWRHLDISASRLDLGEALPSDLQVAEVEIDGKRAGKTLAEMGLRKRFGVTALGVRRPDGVRLTHLSDLSLAEEDRLLVVGFKDGIERLAESFSSGRGVVPLPREKIDREFQLHRRLYELRVAEGSELDGKKLAETHFGDAFGINVLGIRRDDRREWFPGANDLLQVDDVLLVEGRESDFQLLEALQELEPRPPVSTIESLSDEDFGFAEYTLEPRSTKVGRTPRELMFRQRYGLNILAIWHEARAYRTGLGNRPFALGDIFLVHGPREHIESLAADPEFICLTKADATPFRRHRAPLAAGIMGAVLLLVLTGLLPIYVAAPTGALAMVLSGCISMNEAYRFISWRAVLLIAGMLSLGKAMQESGAAELVATNALGSLAKLGPTAVVAGLFLITALAAQVMPTAAVAVLMAPISLSTAEALGLNPHALLMAVAIGSSCAFLSPVGHPVNLLVMSVGGYKFTDYTKVGLPLLFVVFLVVILLLPVVWPLQG